MQRKGLVGRERRKTSHDQINATVSTSDKSCLWLSPLRARKASSASSPQLCLQATGVGERGRKKCLIGAIAKSESSPIIFPIPQEWASPLW